MEQLGYHWRDVREIWYLTIFRKTVQKIEVSLKSDKNKGYFTWRPINILSYISLFIVESEMFQTKVVMKNQNTHFVFSNFFFLSKIVPFMRKCGKIFKSGAGHIWQYCACALHAGYIRLQIHTPRLCNYSLLFHYNNGCTNAPPPYVIHTLPVLFTFALYL